MLKRLESKYCLKCYFPLAELIVSQQSNPHKHQFSHLKNGCSNNKVLIELKYDLKYVNSPVQCLEFSKC